MSVAHSVEQLRMPSARPNLIAALLTRFSTTIATRIERTRQRSPLADLAERNDYLLADIGLTQDEAHREVAKPFWMSSAKRQPNRSDSAVTAMDRWKA
jgi:uncharacterized protein YjiS (DUF1127 family)